MRFNLKNRPLCQKENLQEIFDWFHGFEAELREIEKAPYAGSEPADTYVNIEGEVFINIWEILGE